MLQSRLIEIKNLYNHFELLSRHFFLSLQPKQGCSKIRWCNYVTM